MARWRRRWHARVRRAESKVARDPGRWRLASINHQRAVSHFLTVQFARFNVRPHSRDEQAALRELARGERWRLGVTGIAFGRWRSAATRPSWAEDPRRLPSRFIDGNPNGSFPPCRNAVGTSICEWCGKDLRGRKDLSRVCPAVPPEERRGPDATAPAGT